MSTSSKSTSTRCARAGVAILAIVVAACGSPGEDLPPGAATGPDGGGDSSGGAGGATPEDGGASRDRSEEGGRVDGDGSISVDSGAAPDAGFGDGIDPRDGMGRLDVAPDRTTPDPDDPNCILPPPDPPVCNATGPVPSSPAYVCSLPLDFIIPTGAYPLLLLADAQGIYWGGNADGYIHMVPTGASPTSPELVAYIGDQFFNIDDDAVYFGTPADSGEVTLSKIKRDRTGRVPLVSGVGSGTAIVLDRDFLYFNMPDGRVASVNKSGGTLTETGLGQLEAFRLRVDETHFYWLDAEQRIKRMAKVTSTVEVLAENLGIESMQLQGDGILFLSAGVLRVLPKAGGCPYVLAATETRPSGAGNFSSFVADEQSIDWVAETLGPITPEQTAHQVWRAPRWGGAVVRVGNPWFALGRGQVALSPTQFFATSGDGRMFKIDRK